MTGEDWTLSIDFGTTYTCAVMSFGEQTEVVLVNGEQRMPSAVLSDPNGGLIVGKLAELQAVANPDRLERNPKRRLGDGIFLLGGEPVQVIKAVAEIFRTVADEATRTRGGSVPRRLRLTHPARWAVDGVYVRTLAEAVALARLPDPSFISEPVAAARYFARGDVPDGAQVAVYDLGGGTFDTSVLRRTADGFELMGRPGGIPDLGGEDFDESVFHLIGGQLPEDVWEKVRHGQDHESRRIRMELRRQAREAKEALSVRAEWSFPAPAPVEGTLRITREELEDLIRDRIVETLDELEHTIEAAGSTPGDMRGIYLAGGSSRIPLVQRLVAERFGPNVQMIDEPKTVVARGAAVADRADVEAMATHMSAAAAAAGREAPPSDRPVAAPPTAPTGGRKWTLPVPPRTAATIAGVAVLAAAGIAVAASQSGSGKHNAGTTTSASVTPSTAPTSSASTAPGATVVAVGGGTTPYLGFRVAQSGGPVKGPTGQQLTITDSSGNVVPLTGVAVSAVAQNIKVGGSSSISPAAGAGLASGDIIWGISEVTSSQFTQVVNGTTLSVFMERYASTGATASVYVYFYDPATNRNHASDPVVLKPVAYSSVSAANIDCTRSC